MVRRYLQAEGFDVADAANGETTLHALKNALPDLILLDIGRPGMDGISVLQETPQNLRHPGHHADSPGRGNRSGHGPHDRRR